MGQGGLGVPICFPYLIPFLNIIVQCVCDWDDRDNRFAEVEGIIRRQIKVCNLNVFLFSPPLCFRIVF